jgi:hypothetical protein
LCCVYTKNKKIKREKRDEETDGNTQFLEERERDVPSPSQRMATQFKMGERTFVFVSYFVRDDFIMESNSFTTSFLMRKSEEKESFV